MYIVYLSGRIKILKHTFCLVPFLLKTSTVFSQYKNTNVIPQPIIFFIICLLPTSALLARNILPLAPSDEAYNMGSSYFNLLDFLLFQSFFTSSRNVCSQNFVWLAPSSLSSHLKCPLSVILWSQIPFFKIWQHLDSFWIYFYHSPKKINTVKKMGNVL